MKKSKTLTKLLDRCSKSVIETHSFRNDDTAIIVKDDLMKVMAYLKDEPDLRYDMMMDITAVDYLGEDPRFEVVYHLYSVEFNTRIRIKTRVSEAECIINSVTPLWASANWFEREVYDLYGIHFNGHPELRRILMYEEFKGHPLRKDYPINKRQPLIGPIN